MSRKSSPRVGSPPSRDPIEIPCQVTETDIEEMRERLDSGMADLSTANAIVIALRRHLSPGQGTPALRKLDSSAESGWLLSISGGGCVPLPEEANRWMERWAQAGTIAPISFRLKVPPTMGQVFVRIDARPPAIPACATPEQDLAAALDEAIEGLESLFEIDEFSDAGSRGRAA